MNKPLSVRTKIKASVVLVLLVVVSVGGVWANSRLGTDSSGQSWADVENDKITNSNGKAWTPTEANLQAAIYDLNATGGGKVQLPEATITLTTGIYLISNVTVQGLGKKSILYSAADIVFLYFDGNAFPDDKGPVIRDIFFEATNSHASGTIQIHSSHHFVVENCYFYTVYIGVYVYPGPSDNGRVANNHFNYIDNAAISSGTSVEEVVVTGNIIDGYGGINGIVWHGDRCTISDNTIEEVWDTGIESHSGTGIRILGDDNVLSGNTVRESGSYNLQLAGVRNVVVGNHFSDNYYNAGMYIDGSGHTITGNTIGDSDDESGTPDGQGILTTAASNNITISSNYINYVDEGIVLAGDDLVVIGNIIDNTTKYGISGDGVRLLIVGNSIRDAKYEGMYFVFDYSTISNNRIVGCVREGIQPAAGASYNMIFGNYVEGCSHGIQINGDNNTVFNNDFRQQSANPILDNGDNTIIKENFGYVTENGGANASTVDNGTIVHGLDGTPTYVLVTGTVGNEFISVTGVDATHITVAIKTHSGTPGTSQTVYWRAYYVP